MPRRRDHLETDMEGSQIIIETFGKLLLLYIGVRGVTHVFTVFVRLSKGGF